MPLVDPTGRSEERRRRPAVRRLRTLDGARVGLLGNSKLNADAVLAAVGEQLAQRYALKAVVVRSKPSFSHPVEERLATKLATECDVVIAGVGD